MENLDDFEKRDYEILKGLIGEQKARKYFEGDNYHIKRVFYAIMIATLKKYVKENPYMFVFWVIVIASCIWIIILNSKL